MYLLLQSMRILHFSQLMFQKSTRAPLYTDLECFKYSCDEFKTIMSFAVLKLVEKVSITIYGIACVTPREGCYAGYIWDN